MNVCSKWVAPHRSRNKRPLFSTILFICRIAGSARFDCFSAILFWHCRRLASSKPDKIQDWTENSSFVWLESFFASVNQMHQRHQISSRAGKNSNSKKWNDSQLTPNENCQKPNIKRLRRQSGREMRFPSHVRETIFPR